MEIKEITKVGHFLCDYNVVNNGLSKEVNYIFSVPPNSEIMYDTIKLFFILDESCESIENSTDFKISSNKDGELFLGDIKVGEFNKQDKKSVSFNLGVSPVDVIFHVYAEYNLISKKLLKLKEEQNKKLYPKDTDHKNIDKVKSLSTDLLEAELKIRNLDKESEN